MAFTDFDKVVTVQLDPDTMEELNWLTGINPFGTDNWVSKAGFEDYPNIKKLVSDEQYNAIMEGDIDYIAFRIDE